MVIHVSYSEEGRNVVARRKKDDGFELAWQGLVGIPALVGFWLGFRYAHSIAIGVIAAGVLAGIGIGIVFAFQSAKHEKLKRSGIYEVDNMDGRKFEHYLGTLFQTQGFRVQVTPESGDYGADLVIEKDGTRIVVQAKRYKNNVGVKAVQEVKAAIAHYKAHTAWVVTNSGFTEAAEKLAKSNDIRLIGRRELVGMMSVSTRTKSDRKNKTGSLRT